MQNRIFINTLLCGGLLSAMLSAQAATVTVDGSTVTKLSDAVNTAQATDDGPHTINITTANITDNAPVYITEPMTINGDPGNTGNKCDILVDIPALRIAPAPALASGVPDKAYVVLETSGTVIMNDLKIHPDTDGVDSNGVTEDKIDGVRMLKPFDVDGAGEYLLNNIFISGSDSSNNYIPLDTGADIYSTAAKKWSGGGTGNAVIQMSNQGNGNYTSTLDHCHIGLGQSAALNSPAGGGGGRSIIGGVYGHCGTDGVRISGTGFNIIGTQTDRVRIVRSTNISGGNAHCLEVDGGTLQNLEYVDIAALNTANGIKLNAAGKINNANYVRVMGKFGPGNNSMTYLGGTSKLTMTNSTIVGSGDNYNPFQTIANPPGFGSFTDTIFTSENFGVLAMGGSSTNYTFANCALPQDEYPAESLTTGSTVFTGTQATAFPAPTNTVTSSPMYLLTLNDYDWSDNQGASNPLNGAGNANVLRPSNPAYLTASSTAGPLNGGAGPAISSIRDWMLMEEPKI